VAVAGSELAVKATERYELTLEQAATLAEFDDDPEMVRALVAAVKAGRFDHVAQRARDDRAQVAAYDQTTVQLTEQGVTVVAEPEWDDPKVRDIRSLRHGDDEATPESQAECPGRAAYVHVDRDWDSEQWEAKPVEVCTDHSTHGHTDPSDESRTTGSGGGRKKPVEQMTDEEREQARQQRRLVIDHNKAWTSATEVRRAWLAEWLTRKTPPKGTFGFVAGMIAAHPDLLPDLDANRLAAEWLGQPPASGYGRSDALADLIGNADERRAQVITLALVLAACEAHVGRDTWRRDGTTGWHGPYRGFLADHGYTLADIEDYAASNQTV
jgi:ParB family chromosome partitioning protein